MTNAPQPNNRAFKLAVASGKGGTGKTTLAVNLYHRISKNRPDTALFDCDVEEPNAALLLPGLNPVKETTVFQSVAEINPLRCTYCRKCVEYCEFGAIVVIPNVPFARVTETLCHSCGACLVACEDNAIREKPVEIGIIRHFSKPNGARMFDAALKIGSPMQTLLIRKLKHAYADNSNNITLYDSPPGTSCAVVETVSDIDYVILITEPTPFGMYDISLSIELLRDLKLPFGVVVNKSGLGKAIYPFLAEKKTDIIGEIDFDPAFASTYARGNVLENIPFKIHNQFNAISDKIERMAEKNWCKVN